MEQTYRYHIFYDFHTRLKSFKLSTSRATSSHPVNYVYMKTVSIRLHVKVALRISIGGIAKRSGFFAMCVG